MPCQRSYASPGITGCKSDGSTREWFQCWCWCGVGVRQGGGRMGGGKREEDEGSMQEGRKRKKGVGAPQVPWNRGCQKPGPAQKPYPKVTIFRISQKQVENRKGL